MGLWIVLIVGGVCFVVDLGSWYFGILCMMFVNVMLFGNCVMLMFLIYGFLVVWVWLLWI